MDLNVIVVNALGFGATTFSIIMWLPQARTTWLNRNDPVRLAGISETTQWFLVACCLLWGSYGLVIESIWIVLPNLVSFPLAVTTIVLVRLGRRKLPIVGSVLIIDAEDGFVGGPFTAPVSIVSTESSLEVGAQHTSDSNPTTGAVPVLH